MDGFENHIEPNRIWGTDTATCRLDTAAVWIRLCTIEILGPFRGCESVFVFFFCFWFGYYIIHCLATLIHSVSYMNYSLDSTFRRMLEPFYLYLDESRFCGDGKTDSWVPFNTFWIEVYCRIVINHLQERKQYMLWLFMCERQRVKTASSGCWETSWKSVTLTYKAGGLFTTSTFTWYTV